MSLLSDLLARVTQPAPQWAPGAAPPTGPRLSDMVKGAYKASKAPGDAYNKGMTTDQMINAGNDFAFNFGMMGSLVPKPTNSLGMFGGRLAQTADLDALHQAVKLERAGANPNAIWQSTGWGRGADGKWRFEISDKNASLNWDGKEFLDSGGPGTMKMGDAFNHPELYAAYPQLKDISLTPNTIKGTNGVTTESGIALTGGRRPVSMNSTALHELQHKIQKYEGWGQGNNSADPLNNILYYANALPKDKQFDLVMLLDKLSPKGYDKLYRNSAGEVEARNTQKRMFLDPVQRRSRPFWNDEDVARNAQLIFGVRK